MSSGFIHKYLYCPKSHRFTRATIYYEIQPDCSVVYAVSFCSPKDRFVKKTGRDLALKRFINGETHKVVFRKKHFLNLVIEDMMTKTPSWGEKVFW